MRLHKKIPFLEIEGIPALIKDFLRGNVPQAKEHLFDAENFRAKILAKQESYSAENRNILCKVLEDQMLHSRSEAQSENLLLLKKSNTFTVTTGHQLNLFSGPVFFIYKILQTIKTAEYLKSQFPDHNFVPVFWMATEDHDFDEISFFNTGNETYHLKAKAGGAVGRIVLQDVSFISRFEAEFRDSVFGTELILMLKEAYVPGKTLAEATRVFVNRLFSDYGLLILDGDDSRLKNLMIPCFSDELQNSALAGGVQHQVDYLTEHYGQVQVNPRDINLFYLSETRNRIDKVADKFVLAETDRTFTAAEITKELENHPERFSPNALMRPVYQETVMPNIAYIGGNAEIMYWLELTDYFKENSIPFPILIPRNSFLNLKSKTVRKMDRHNLEIEDFFGDYNSVINRKILANNDIQELLNEKAQEVAAAFQSIRELASKTDCTFGNLVAAEETRQLKSYSRMSKRLLRAEKIKQYELVTSLQNLYLQIHPGKNWQERVFNFSLFYADDGNAWLKTCLEEMDVTKSELIVIED